MEILVYPRYSMRLTERVTPLKPLEAMAMARPVVASSVGGHRELLRHGQTGILFEPGNLSSLVQALDRVLADGDLRTRMAAHAREWVLANRTWKKTTAGYSEIYSRALAARPRFEWASRAAEHFREAL
jgi:glycosyltransferase involved in cell wall biosynthesis